MFDYGEFMQKTFVNAVTTAAILMSPIVGPSVAFSWGQKGHQAINKVAISMVNHQEGRKFLAANSEQFIRFASTPDTKWKSGPNADKEKPLHWFEFDGYGTSNLGEGIADLLFSHAREQLGGEFVTKYGMSMWRVSDFYTQLIAALKNKDWPKALQIGGVMGHYIGDMTQPMHGTTDYDGQSIERRGIHSYYETKLVNAIKPDELYDALIVSAGERRSDLERSLGNDLRVDELQHATYDEIEGAFNGMEQILPQFDRDQYNDAWLTKDLKPRMARASAMLGKIWDVAFIMSGARGMPRENLAVQEPEWMPFDPAKQVVD